METHESVSLAVSIALGVISVGVSAFAVWLSMQFNSQSTAALDSIKSLANEIKGLTQANLNQQKDMSVKMLDSIIERNHFGASASESEESIPPSALEKVVKDRLDVAEGRIGATVENTVRRLMSDNGQSGASVDAAVASIKEDIGKLVASFEGIASDTVLSPELSLALRKMVKLPAHFVVLDAIVREGVTTPEEMKALESTYNFPEGYDDGISNLIKHGLLIGSSESFQVNPEYATGLASWLDINAPVIRKLVDFYSKEIPVETTADELEIALDLRF